MSGDEAFEAMWPVPVRVVPADLLARSVFTALRRRTRDAVRGREEWGGRDR